MWSPSTIRNRPCSRRSAATRLRQLRDTVGNHPRRRRERRHAATPEAFASWVLAALVLNSLFLWSSIPSGPSIARSTPYRAPIVADFGAETSSPHARLVADWVVATNDAAESPFVIIDKVAARIYVFG